MKTIEKQEIKAEKISAQTLTEILKKYNVIDELILESKSINPELNKNFVTFSISNNVITE
jgi:hypothetical protein